MRRVAFILLLVAAGVTAFATTSSAGEEEHSYTLEMYNAFGLVEGSEVKVAGVTAGTVESLDISSEKTALIAIKLSGPLAVLGDRTQCASEPQSLIAEYFIDCQPAGAPLDDGEIVPNKVKQTVQNDLVLNTLRMPFKQRLALLINEFGTALAGNPENLNEAIRLGAPALADLHSALRLLARQNTVIRDLNVNSDEIVQKLADRREDVTSFIKNAGEAAAVSAERRDDLSSNFDLLDNFLAELGPTMVELKNTADQSSPLLSDLRAAAPQLNELAVSLPPFNRATERSLTTLGKASVTGRRALNLGVRKGTFKALANSADQAPRTGDLLAKFLTDLDDPTRAVEVDDRAAKTCADKTLSCYATGRSGPTGYTGLEGLLNYAYYQTGALNSYDSVGHLLHFQLYDVFTGPCGEYNARQDFPAEGGGRTTDPLQAASCVGGLGPNQPGITPGESEADLGIGPYDPAVCPDGSTDTSICDPTGPRRSAAKTTAAGNSVSESSPAPGGSDTGSGGGGAGTDLPDLPAVPGGGGGSLGDLLDELPGNLGGQLGAGKGGKRGGKGNHGGLGGGGNAANDLLDFLFAP